MEFTLSDGTIVIASFLLFGLSIIVPLITNQSYRNTVIDHLTFRDPFGFQRFTKHPIIMLIQFTSLVGPILLYSAYLKFFSPHITG